MLTISIITIHPAFVQSYASFGVISKAIQSDQLRFNAISLRDFGLDKHGTVDDRPYGGGDGMVMRCEPLASAVRAVKPDLTIALGPAGKKWTQKEAEQFTKKAQDIRIAIVCGRFGGIDERFYDNYVDVEYSVGDYVLSGGELAALIMVDSMARLLPGALGHKDSARLDSFSKDMGGLLEYPLYTRPAEFEGLKVPEVLLSGNHQEISDWRMKEAIKRTQRLRPDLLG